MDNWIAGVLAVLLIVLFLGFYAVKLVSIPLWIIILGTLAMVIADFYGSTKKDNGQNGG